MIEASERQDLVGGETDPFMEFLSVRKEHCKMKVGPTRCR